MKVRRRLRIRPTGIRRSKDLVREQTQQFIQYPEAVFEAYSRHVHSKRQVQLDLISMMLYKEKRNITIDFNYPLEHYNLLSDVTSSAAELRE